MSDWFKSLFGKGRVRIEFTTLEGKPGTAKVPYIGEYDETAMLNHFIRALKVDYNLTAKTVKVIGHVTE